MVKQKPPPITYPWPCQAMLCPLGGIATSARSVTVEIHGKRAATSLGVDLMLRCPVLLCFADGTRSPGVRLQTRMTMRIASKFDYWPSHVYLLNSHVMIHGIVCAHHVKQCTLD